VSATHIENQRNGSVAEPGERTGQVNDRRSLRAATLTGELSLQQGVFATRVGFSAGRRASGYRYLSEIEFLEDLVPVPNGGLQINRDFNLRPEGQQYAAYLTSRMSLSQRLTAEVGGRWDRQTYTSGAGRDQYSPRISLLFKVNEKTRLRASWGRFFQAQPINGLQVEDGVDQFFSAQRAEHTIIGLERGLAEGFDLRVELYRKEFSSLQPRFENLFDPLVLLPELEADRVRVAPQGARAEGIEVLLTRRSHGPWSWWLNYVWSRVEDDIDGVNFPRNWDQRRAAKLGATRSGEKWDLSIAGTLRSGWPTTLAFLEAVDDGAGNLTQQVVLGPRNGARLGAFSSLDIKATRRFKLRDSELEAFIDITNALLRRNPCCIAYSLSEPTPGSYQLDREVEYWPRIVPNLGVLWKF
jgi:outer membrane receptor protein involved in Fe transport